MGPSVLGGGWVGLGVCLGMVLQGGLVPLPASEWSVGGSQCLEKERERKEWWNCCCRLHVKRLTEIGNMNIKDSF